MKKIVRLTESDLHRIVKESLGRILKESEDDVLEQTIEKCRRPYRNFKYNGNEADRYTDTLSEMMEDDKSNPQIKVLRKKIEDLRKKQFDLLNFILSLVNSNGEKLLSIGDELSPNDDFWYGPYLENGQDGEYEHFYEIFKICMDSGKSFLDSRQEFFERRNQKQKEDNDWKNAQEMHRQKEMQNALKDKWIEDYKAPSNTPFNVKGKMKLDPKDLNKKRW